MYLCMATGETDYLGPNSREQGTEKELLVRLKKEPKVICRSILHVARGRMHDAAFGI